MEGRIVACAGCSRRRTPFGGNGSPLKDDSLFDPARDAARWGLFVHPRLPAAASGACSCARASRPLAIRVSPRRADLHAEMALYAARRFEVRERLELLLVNGSTLPAVRMEESAAITVRSTRKARSQRHDANSMPG